MNSTDPASLDRMNDFVFPDAVGFWPLAPVWTFAIALLLVWIATWIWIQIVRYIRNAYRREAIAELKLIEADGDVVRLSELLKRTAMTAYGRDAVASLYGDVWLEFLAGKLPPTHELSVVDRSAIHRSDRGAISDNPSFSQLEFSVLGDISSRTSFAMPEEERAKLFSFAGDWIRHHRVESSSLAPSSLAPSSRGPTSC